MVSTIEFYKRGSKGLHHHSTQCVDPKTQYGVLNTCKSYFWDLIFGLFYTNLSKGVVFHKYFGAAKKQLFVEYLWDICWSLSFYFRFATFFLHCRPKEIKSVKYVDSFPLTEKSSQSTFKSGTIVKWRQMGGCCWAESYNAISIHSYHYMWQRQATDGIITSTEGKKLVQYSKAIQYLFSTW